MISPFHLQSIAEISASHIAASLIEGTAIALMAWFALRLTRRQNSSARFAIWFAALMTIAGLPVLGSLAITHNVSASAGSTITLPSQWALYVFAGWAIVAMLSVARIAVSLVRVRGLRKSCVPVDEAHLDPSLRETLADAQVGRAVTLCTSSEVQVPTAIGFFEPAIVIPDWLLEALSPEELKQIILHELAHLRRRDDWTNLAQQIVKALFFFHPAVWWIEKKISLEREMACDDAVLAATEKPRAYAECLTHLAERTFIRRSIALAQAALGHVRNTSLRVAQILNPDRPSSRHSLKPAFALMAICAVGSTVVASRAPRLVAFQDFSNPAPQSPPKASILPTRGNSTAGNALALNSAVSAMLKPIPASFVTPPAPKRKKLLHSHPVLRTANKPAAPPSIAPIESAFIFSAGASLFHLTAATDSADATQTIFFVVQRNDAGHVTYQIQMWHFTVFHPTAPPAAKIPNKET